MKRSIFPLILAFFLLVPGISGKEISLDVEGECLEYDVTLSLMNFSEGCYDVKIDINTEAGRVGEIFDLKEGWKSSFFYIREDICVGEIGEVSKMYKLFSNTNSEVLNFQATLRSGSVIYQSGYYQINQICPGLDEDVGWTFWLIVLLTLILFSAGLLLYLYQPDN